MKNKLSNVLVAGLVAYFGYQLYQSQVGDGTSLQNLVVYISGVVLGTGFLLFDNLSSLPSLNISSFFNREPQPRVFSPAVYEQKDFECLIHLRNRLATAGSKEGLLVISKLNDIIFQLHNNEKEPTRPMKAEKDV